MWFDVLTMSVYIGLYWAILVQTIKTRVGRESLYRCLALARRDEAYTPNQPRSSMAVIQAPSSDWSVAELHPCLPGQIRGADLSRTGCVRPSILTSEEGPGHSMRARHGRPGESAEVEQVVRRPGLGVYDWRPRDRPRVGTDCLFCHGIRLTSKANGMKDSLDRRLMNSICEGR